jgi:hypothetical protein
MTRVLETLLSGTPAFVSPAHLPQASSTELHGYIVYTASLSMLEQVFCQSETSQSVKNFDVYLLNMYVFIFNTQMDKLQRSIIDPDHQFQ